MGEESDALEAQSDGGAWEDCRYYESLQRDKQRAFKSAVAAEVAKQLKRTNTSIPRGQTQTYCCKTCGQSFMARTADRKRGWARFCSKSCAAIWKDRASCGVNRKFYGE